MKTAIITLTGDLGSGKTTVGKLLCERLKYDYLYTGDIQRRIAERLGMTTVELNIYSETHPEIDEEIDSTFRNMNGGDGGYVVDSRLAWHFIPGSFKVYLAVDLEVAASRIIGDFERKSERYATAVEAMEGMITRKNSENKRYKDLYGVDCGDMSHYDLIVNTSNLVPEAVANRIIEEYQNFLQTR